MHFTLWPSLRATTGGYCDLTLDQLRDLVAAPAVSARKEDMEGWSPAKFRDDRRGLQHVESVSTLVLDVDSGDHELAALRGAFAGKAGLVHSSWSHAHRKDGTPDTTVRKWRVVLFLSRDVTADEYARLWTTEAATLALMGIVLDPAARDASRFWFVPGRRAPDAPYAWCDLPGEHVDVDSWLASNAAGVQYGSSGQTGQGNRPAESRRHEGSSPSHPAAAPPTHPAALALGRAWPATGRHQAQLALAGALRGEGFTAEAALEFLCATCAAAGDEDRPKREATVRHTYSRPADAPTTGWTRLAAHVPALIVDAVRAQVGRGAAFADVVARRLAETRSATISDPSARGVADAGDIRYVIPINSGSLDNNSILCVGGAELEEPMPDLAYLVRELGLVAGGGAPHLVAGYGFSGKTLALQSMILSLAAGLPVWGAFPVARPLRVLHVDLEQGDLTKRRYQRLARGMGLDMRSLGDRLAVAIMPRIKLEAGEVRWIDLMAGRDVMVVDSLRAACGGSENDSEFRGALDTLGTISHATNCRAAVVHHAKKPSADDSEARYSIRGSSAIYDAVDSAYVFGAAKDEPIKVEHVKARSHGELGYDRALVISDVAVGGDPKGGLRVHVVATEALAEAKALREKDERLARAVADAGVLRRILTAHPGLNTGELQATAKAEVSWGKDRVNDALVHLRDEIATDTIQRAKRYFLK